MREKDVQVNEKDTEKEETMWAIRTELKLALDPWLDDEPSVMPLPQHDPFKGVDGWMEALLQ